MDAKQAYSLSELYAKMMPRNLDRYLTSRLLWRLAVRLSWLAVSWARWMEEDDGRR